jgi:hypothetical protein
MISVDLITSLFHLLGKWIFHIDVALTRKRDAKRFLKKGRALLASGRTHEADIQISLALRLCPDVINSLSQSERIQIITEIEAYRGSRSSYL